jgi:hypothetical protein
MHVTMQVTCDYTHARHNVHAASPPINATMTESGGAPVLARDGRPLAFYLAALAFS